MNRAFKALLFDLDDTLMDTYGQLVAPAAQEACVAMVKAGLDSDVETAFLVRARLFRSHPRDDLYALVTQELGCRDGASARAVRDAGHNAFFHRSVERHIRPFPDTKPTLTRLRERYRLFLVTSGHPETQGQKIDILGIRDYFEDVHLVHPESGQTKQDAFARIMALTGLPAAAHLVIGDRVNGEIAAANRLGMGSCRMRHGEFLHLNPASKEETPHWQIDSPASLLQLL